MERKRFARRWEYIYVKRLKKKKTLQSAFSHECIVTLGKNQSKHCSDETSAATVNIIL